MKRKRRPPKRFKWVIEFTVDRIWVEDGFDPDDDQAHAMLSRTLTSAYGHEMAARVLKRPKDADIAEAQGYDDVKVYRKDNWKGRERR